MYDNLSSSSESLTSLSTSVTSDSEYYSTSETSSDQSGALSGGLMMQKQSPLKQNQGKSSSCSGYQASSKVSTTSLPTGTLNFSVFSQVIVKEIDIIETH